MREMMNTANYHDYKDISKNYMVWFFAGGETRDDRFNVFTGSFIRLMKQIFENKFEYIKGIYFKAPMRNVIWALNNAQRPLTYPENQKITSAAFRQITAHAGDGNHQLIIISSSSGSVVAAQTACYLARENRDFTYFKNPFDIVLGASMISKQSELFKQLIQYQNEGVIGTIIYDEVQDSGDTSEGIGGLSRKEAYSNAFGLMFPFFSGKFKGPSFLNTNPVTGHLHRKRSKTVKKALDYIDVILIKKRLAGEEYKEKATVIINCEKQSVDWGLRKVL